MQLDRERWTTDVVLADGGTVRVRPIEPGDAERLEAFHARQSRESVYFRFFSPRPHLSVDEVRHLVTVDGTERMAFVAVLDDDFVGVARYDRHDGDDDHAAEVAFFTDDGQRGRGIATVLLEYLAERAREVGMTEFTATVLPENRRMARVFRAAGFTVDSRFDEGVLEFRLGLEPTPEVEAAVAARALQAERQSVSRLLAPRTVAVIGAGRDPAGVGHRVVRNLLAGPFAGAVHPVNSDAFAVAGVRAFPSVRDIPDPVDLAVVCVPAPAVEAVVEDCAAARVRAAAIISAGFAEESSEGRAREERIVAIARRSGLRILGPNCLGVVNTDPEVRLHATFADIRPLPGRVGMLSQSGTLGAVVLERARSLGLGVSSFVAVGNKADISGNDVLLYWADDDHTDVVVLYLESFGNPRRFSQNVQRVARTKPVFAVRSGATLHGPSDLGLLDDDTVDTLLRQNGVVRVPTISALLDAALVATTQPAAAGHRVAIVGNSGGSSSLAADACAESGLVLADLAPGTLDALGAARLTGRPVDNPVDLRFDADAADFRGALDAVLADPGVDSALVIYAPYEHDDYGAIVAELDRVSGHRDRRPVVACIFGRREPTTPGGVPVFEFPDQAAVALGNHARYGAWRQRLQRGTICRLEDPSAVRAVIGDLLDAGALAGLLAPEPVMAGRPLPAVDARRLLRAAGVDAVAVDVLTSFADVDAVALPGPVAVKAASREPGARTEEAGVALDIHDRDALRTTLEAMAGHLGADRLWPVLVQPMVETGDDVRVACRVHPVVGPVVQVGPGGIAGRYVDASARAMPLTDLDVDDLLAESGLGDALGPDAMDALRTLVSRLTALVDAVPEVVDLVCDPVIVRPSGVDIVDVHVTVAPVPPDDRPAVRRI